MPFDGPETAWCDDPARPEQSSESVLDTRPLANEASAMLGGPSPGPNFWRRDVHRWHFIKVQELGKLLGVSPIVLLLRPEDQTKVAGMCDIDSLRNT